jgi:outer membrane protein
MSERRSIDSRSIGICAFLAASLLFGIGAACAQSGTTEEFPMRMQGDLGVGAYYTRSIVRGKSEPADVLPYGYFDYGRAFVRIDTFGIKTAKLGYGYIELVGRVTLDGFKADTSSLIGMTERKNSLPLGIGTFQETPIGGFFLNAFHDVNKSNGNLFEAMYVGELTTSRVNFYPQFGAEYLSKQYVGYYYGVSATESAASGYAAYQGSGAFNPFAGVLIDTRLTDTIHLNFYARHKWLAGGIKDSPIVGRSSMDTAFIALSYRFK